jgi:predicted nuclease of predicted toxin-antitoxin system
MMRILADENCDDELVAALRSGGHDILYASESMPGAEDEAVYKAAMAEQRILLTNDLDFGLIAERSEHQPLGVVLMRLHPLRPPSRTTLVVSFFATATDPSGKFVVLEPGVLRTRNLQSRPQEA